MSGGTVRYWMFVFMAVWTGVFTAISTAGAVTSAVIVFGYGVDQIIDAIRERR